MPTLTINLPPKQYKKLGGVARREGFKTPSEWARFLVEKNMGFQNSQKLTPSKIISEMEKTGLYKKQFLHGLKKSLEYADKTA